MNLAAYILWKHLSFLALCWLGNHACLAPVPCVKRHPLTRPQIGPNMSLCGMHMIKRVIHHEFTLGWKTRQTGYPSGRVSRKLV